MTQTSSAYRARVLSALDDHSLFFLSDACIKVDTAGDIASIEPYQNSDSATPLEDEHGLMTVIPPFCDVHFHWVQDRVMAMGKENLLDWLKTYVFPEEARFADPEYARRMAVDFFQRLTNRGTLGGCVYASVHEPSVQAAFEAAQGRFRVGNVIMTNNSPDFLEQKQHGMRALVEGGLEKYGSRYILTPRFALSCEPAVLETLGALSEKHGAWVQTHLSETTQEIEETLKLYRSYPGYEDVDSYLEVYERAGLVHSRSIYGHCIHMQDQELQLMAKKGARIAHCPTSNAPTQERGLGSGLMDLNRVNQFGVQWALATDIGAGPYLSMLDVMRSYLMQHRCAGRTVNAASALYRATSKAFDLMGETGIGNLKAGEEASFVALSSSPGFSDPEDWLESLLVLDRDELDTLPMKVFHKGQALV